MPLPLSIVVYRRHFCLNSCAAGLLRHRDSISNCCTKRRWAVQAIAGIFPPLMTGPLPGARTCRPASWRGKRCLHYSVSRCAGDSRNPSPIHEMTMARSAYVQTCVLEREAVFALLGIASRSDGRNPSPIHEIAMANRASIYTTQLDEVERIRL